MTAIKAHFDGKVLVPDEPVNLPVNQPLHLLVAPVPAGKTPMMMALLEALEQMPDNPTTPDDLAAQHDHYLHGLPKRS